ncbi:MAG TPA: SDR family NAD(P)-dependent oxidoreductase [Vineibacter sp.]|nr:SDR family NAD(P)-dependent oxidoreductase [Vineibacter sp.]
MSDKRTALVIGATGGIGAEVALNLGKRGWRVRAMHRRPAVAAQRFAELGSLDWVPGDAMVPADVAATAAGTQLIVHAANPPGYRNWRGLALPMLDSTIAAAEAAGARIVFPGTIYNFGPDAFPSLRETSPQNPHTRKGAIRVEMERRLEAAAGRGVRTLVVRAGDFFGPRAGNSWFAQGLVKPGKPVRSVVYPGRPDVGHAWAYLPDLAEAIVQLIERGDALAAFDVFHFRGHVFERGIEIAEAIRRVVGDPRLPIRSLPWMAIRVLAPLVTTFREMLEMQYLWRQSVTLDNTKLVAALGAEPHTPLDRAVAVTLAGLGCRSGGIDPAVDGGDVRIVSA